MGGMEKGPATQPFSSSVRIYWSITEGQRLYKRNLSLYFYMFIAVTLTSSVPMACSRLTL